MAPEQRVHGVPLSERTDVYALGLLLYELLVGRIPFNRPGETGPPPKPSSLVPNVDPQLERVILQAISRDPQDRPASAIEMGANLPRAGTTTLDAGYAVTAPLPSRVKTHWWLAGGALAAAVAILAVVFSHFFATGGRRLTEQDTIVLADFDNTTRETVRSK
jgi:serine/threonine protein kinase